MIVRINPHIDEDCKFLDQWRFTFTIWLLHVIVSLLVFTLGSKTDRRITYILIRADSLFVFGKRGTLRMASLRTYDGHILKQFDSVSSSSLLLRASHWSTCLRIGMHEVRNQIQKQTKRCKEYYVVSVVTVITVFSRELCCCKSKPWISSYAIGVASALAKHKNAHSWGSNLLISSYMLHTIMA